MKWKENGHERRSELLLNTLLKRRPYLGLKASSSLILLRVFVFFWWIQKFWFQLPFLFDCAGDPESYVFWLSKF